MGARQAARLRLGRDAARGSAIAYVGFLGAFEVLDLTLVGAERGGGRIGRFVAGILEPLLTSPGAFVVLLAIGIVGLMLAFNLRLRQVVRPVTGTAKWVGGAAAASMRREPEAVGPGRTAPAANGNGNGTGKKGAAVAGAAGAKAVAGTTSSPGQTGIWGGEAGDDSRIPAAVPSTRPDLGDVRPGHAAAKGWLPPRRWSPIRRDRSAALDDVTDAGDSPPTKERIEYRLPPLELLEDVATPIEPGGSKAVHERNEEIIIRKLASFEITGPDRRPQRRPGRDPVRGPAGGRRPSVAGSRRSPTTWRWPSPPAASGSRRRSRARAPSASRSRTRTSTSSRSAGSSRRSRSAPTESKLTFALGRDVAGEAQAVDLAKMPHLLIAGATGSGKSVMVNALITSLLCKATPDDVRMILMDLKRVELATYNGLPHLLVPVITEPERAKAALKWAVNEMEGRYRRFAGATRPQHQGLQRDPGRPRGPDAVHRHRHRRAGRPDDARGQARRGPDRPARPEGAGDGHPHGPRDPAAVGQRRDRPDQGELPVSRIAFAMASQIDSRTILDAPGAEDLIGRGDMLYQPVGPAPPDAPPGRVRLRSARSAGSSQHWTDQIENPHYDMAIIESDDEGTGSVDDLADEDADRLLPDAVEVIREYDRASASLLQRRLKVGYARAARIIDQLEARGYIGAFDGSNARQVLRREGGAATQGAVGDDADEDGER